MYVLTVIVIALALLKSGQDQKQANRANDIAAHKSQESKYVLISEQENAASKSNQNPCCKQAAPPDESKFWGLTHGEVVQSVLTFSLVVITAIYALISLGMLRAIKADGDLARLQWVNVDRWIVVYNEGKLTVSFDVVNPTHRPLVIEGAKTTIQGKTSTFGKRVTLTPQSIYRIHAIFDYTEERAEEIKAGTFLPVAVVITFSGTEKSSRDQLFSGVLLWTEPEALFYAREYSSGFSVNSTKNKNT